MYMHTHFRRPLSIYILHNENFAILLTQVSNTSNVCTRHTGPATMLRPCQTKESIRSSCSRRISDILFYIRDTAALRTTLWHGAWGEITAILVNSIVFPLRPQSQCDAHTTTSRRPGHVLNATIIDLDATLHRCHQGLRRPHCIVWAPPLRLWCPHVIHTTTIQPLSAFRCIYGSIPWQEI